AGGDVGRTLRGRHPEPAAAEGIGRQLDPPAPPAPVDRRPVEVAAAPVAAGERLERAAQERLVPGLAGPAKQREGLAVPALGERLRGGRPAIRAPLLEGGAE